jgi:hypothetical protein
MSLEQGLYLYSDLLLIYYIDGRDKAKDTERGRRGESSHVGDVNLELPGGDPRSAVISLYLGYVSHLLQASQRATTYGQPSSQHGHQPRLTPTTWHTKHKSASPNPRLRIPNLANPESQYPSSAE